MREYSSNYLSSTAEVTSDGHTLRTSLVSCCWSLSVVSCQPPKNGEELFDNNNDRNDDILLWRILPSSGQCVLSSSSPAPPRYIKWTRMAGWLTAGQCLNKWSRRQTILYHGLESQTEKVTGSKNAIFHFIVGRPKWPISYSLCPRKLCRGLLVRQVEAENKHIGQGLKRQRDIGTINVGDVELWHHRALLLTDVGIFKTYSLLVTDRVIIRKDRYSIGRIPSWTDIVMALDYIYHLLMPNTQHSPIPV